MAWTVTKAQQLEIDYSIADQRRAVCMDRLRDAINEGNERKANDARSAIGVWDREMQSIERKYKALASVEALHAYIQ